MEELVLNNINLIYLVLKRHKKYEVLDDYFDLGMIGLVNAAKTYSEDSGFTFSTYAYKCIENEILKTRRKELALKRGAGQPSISLETTITCKDENIKLLDMIPDKFNLEEYIIQNEFYEELYKEIDDLPERNKFVICSIFGLKDYEKLTERELAQKFNISQPVVNRLKNKTIKILRNKLGDTIGC